MDTPSSSFVNYCECLSPVSPTGKVIAARVGIVIFTAFLVAAMLVVTLSTIPAVSFMLGAILVFCAWFVWQFTKIEYEYTIASGSLQLDKIYGARTRKTVAEFKISQIEQVFPQEQAARLTAGASNVLWACSKKDAYALGLAVTDGNAKRIYFICAPDKTRACLKYYKGSLFAASCR